MRRLAFLLLASALLCGRAVGGGTRDAAATLVLFNKNDADSKGLAQYYAGKRGIPPEQVVGLRCPEQEEITRADYESDIAAPLRKLLRSRGWWKMGKDQMGASIVSMASIRYVAIMRGMPLKIAPDPTIPPSQAEKGLPIEITSRNEASVDSELATLGLFLPSPAGIYPNPYYRRFTPILQDPIPPGILLPARLDGPTASIVRAMIDDSLDAERDGLYGWAYVDGRGITSGGYAEGDQWMANVVVSLRQQGVPVIFDNNPATFPPGYPVTEAAVYFGWYAPSIEGPFAQPGFGFRPGAIAVHLHSFSASTLRSPTAGWCGPLLARGAAATLGNVYEPYLSLTANFDIFQDRLMAGFNLAESGWMSQRVLSWMGVVVGDPLYRPYATWRKFQPSEKMDDWKMFRTIILAASGNTLAAAPALREAGEKSRNGMFFEALASAQMDVKDWAGALASLGSARDLTKNPAVGIRLDLESVVALRASGKIPEAQALAQSASVALPPGAQKNLFVPFLPPPPPTPVPDPSAGAAPMPGQPSSTPVSTPEPSPVFIPAPTPTPTPTPTATPIPPPPPPPPIPEMRP